MLASPLSAAELTGTVTDLSSGVALEGVVVSIPQLGARTTTNRRGYYEFSDLESDTYTVSFRYVGAVSEEANVDLRESAGTSLDTTLSLNVFELDAYEVSAGESATARAINIQRASVNLTEVVASDFFGQFADSNAAEALNRVPGVLIERDQGEGRFVVIRGLNPNLTSVAIDGVSLAAPSASERSTLLDTIPIEVLDTLEISKAVLPSQPGDSIGGFVNLRSPSAFNFSSMTASLSGSVLYSDLVEDSGYKVFGSYSDTFGADDTWGLYLTLINSERTFGSDNVESDPWIIEEDVAADYIPDDTIEYREYDLVRERTGVSANLEYKSGDNNLFFVRASYNNYKDTETRDLGKLEFPAVEEDDDGNITEIFFTEVSPDSLTNSAIAAAIELKEREENMRIGVLSAGGEQVLGDWSIDYTLAISQAEEDTPFDYEVIYEASDVTEGRLSETASYNPMLGSFLGGVDYSDPSEFEYDELTIGEQLVEETDLSGRVNAQYDFNQTVLKYVKFGAVVRNKDKESDFDQRSADSDAGIESADLFEQTERRNPFGRPISSLDTAIFDFALANLPFEDDSDDSQIEDYQTNEDVSAAYFMSGFEIQGWKIIAGARVEHTDFETEGFEFNEDSGVITAVRFDKDYTNVLPGIHVRREFNEDLIVRASWTNTISRPTFEQSRPGIVREGDEVERGNPTLDPYEAMNIDLSLQYNSSDFGNFGAALFFKDIENFIYEQTFEMGSDEVTTFENGDNGSILGLELSYYKNLGFLPGLLSGLNLSANLTFLESDADAQRPGGGEVENIRFIKQSDTIGNVSLGWEYDRYVIRLSASYRDDYLDELGEEAAEDRYVDDFLQLDLYSSIRVYEDLTIFAELNNLTNEPFRAYWGESRRLSQFEEYGISGALGAKWSF